MHMNPIPTKEQAMNLHNHAEPNPVALSSARTPPEPVCRGPRIGAGDGRHWTFSSPRRGDHFDVTSGECRVALIKDGVRYDTARATFVARHSSFVYEVFEFRWLYRADHGAWFMVTLRGRLEQLRETSSVVLRVPSQSVFETVRTMVEPEDCLRFLVEWYGAGWIPRDDAAARAWAEDALSADDCEVAHAAIASLPALV